MVSGGEGSMLMSDHGVCRWCKWARREGKPNINGIKQATCWSNENILIVLKMLKCMVDERRIVCQISVSNTNYQLLIYKASLLCARAFWPHGFVPMFNLVAVWVSKWLFYSGFKNTSVLYWKHVVAWRI